MSTKKKGVLTARNTFLRSCIRSIMGHTTNSPIQNTNINHSSSRCISTEIRRLSFVALGQLAFMSFDNMLGYAPFIWL